MEYTIKKVAELSGVSPRTLRYYDELDLLKPKQVTKAGYRLYGEAELDRLQQILFYRTLDFPLATIKEIMTSPSFDLTAALEAQQQALLEKRQQVDALLETIDKTLAYHKGEITMTEPEKFAAFKQQKIAENEATYGAEIRENYGEETIDAANQKLQQLSEVDYEMMQDTEAQLLQALQHYLSEPTKTGAATIFQLHKTWLQFSWPNYSLKAHQGLAQLYLADSRFTAYYDQKAGEGATAALVAIIQQAE